ncbi:hypothetical protein CO038_02585 [Candidatus Pacearchaeota archaeon CG_4_9_14_0_2_um_filter_39_13]|nr:hypothetical protein [Candidatus Pacearchaeota archaeon]OIO44125.1 MAG: hypothetical protein AUJ64_00710 [Candidatus Pacearchaeota archaeon CG1_02_39_14]PJC44671.1 MAG: hypothetical protein CO038_02585 [Candidatus Pacearchaeota archaeon CG_4_9_14_0_2_um_filter_39_13]
MDSGLESYLKENSIGYKLYRHPAVHKVQESKRLKSKIPGLHCKALFLKDENGTFYLVGMKADKKLDTKIIRSHFKIKKLHFASEQELETELKTTPGTVSIYNLVNAKNPGIILIIDKEILRSESSGFHPNTNTETITLDSNNMERYLNSLEIKKVILEL